MGIGEVISALRTVDKLLTLETKHGKAIEKLADEIDKLKDRVTRLETREEILIVKAEAAAGAAASAVVTHSMSDLARRIGSLEERGSRAHPDVPKLTPPP